MPLTCRVATHADLPALETIAGSAFGDSRFWFDQRFPRPAVERLYRIWVARSVTEATDTVLVVDKGGEAVGFICCRLLEDGSGEVPLAGLSPQMRGRGVGLALYAEALRWFESHGVNRVRYVTQGRNIKAQRVLQRLGFLLESARVWYHCWFPRADSRLAS